jgi:predicted TIM-barrel fold metal-dependent hydrolase
MWNGVGPGFLKYQPGAFGHIDEMKAVGFEWDNHPGAHPRPTTPELRLADLDRDGLDKEIVYGCLMINDLVDTGERRAWANKIYNDWAADFAKRSDPNRVFPLAIIPNNDPIDAAAEVRRCAKMGLRGGDLAFKRMTPPLYHHGWYPLWEAAAECRFPISFHSTGFKALRAPDTPQMEQEYMLQWRLVRSALFQLDTMEVLVSLIASGACEKYPDFNFVLGESGVTWLPYVFDRLDTEYNDRARALGFSLKPSDYFRRQGYVTYQQDQYLEPIIPLIGEDNIIWGADYPHPDCIWPESRRHLDANLRMLPERVRRKITSENVSRLYQLI